MTGRPPACTPAREGKPNPCPPYVPSNPGPSPTPSPAYAQEIVEAQAKLVAAMDTDGGDAEITRK